MADPISMTMLASTVLTTVGQIQQGQGANEAAQYQAAQLEQNAGQARASAQRDAIEERRQAALANSRLQALAGGGGLDPTIVHLAQNIAGEGEYRALTALYGGEERARGMETSASARRFEGEQAQRASYFKAAGTIFGASPGLYERYGKGGPDAANWDMYSTTGDQIRGRR